MLDFDFYAQETSDYQEEIGAFVAAVYRAVESWLDSHSKDEWMEALLDNWKYSHGGAAQDIDNGYGRAIIEVAPVIRSVYFEYLYDEDQPYICGQCDRLYFASEDPDCDCADDGHDHDDDEEADRERHAEWCEEVFYDVQSRFCELPGSVVDQVMDRLYSDLSDHFGLDAIIAHCEATIERLENAEDYFDLLAAAIAGTSIEHVGGNVCEDYGEGMERSWIDQLRNSSPLAVWGEDALNEWLAQDGEPEVAA